MATLALALVGGAGPAAVDSGAALGVEATRLPDRLVTGRDLPRMVQQVQDDMRADPRRPARPEVEPALAYQA
jgi:hypothetical protein